MKKPIFIALMILLGLELCFSSAVQAQVAFNDTMLRFDILRVREAANSDKTFYLGIFETQSSTGKSMTGRIAMGMCNCYCDSLWDAWPRTPPSDDSLFTGGAATLTHTFSSSSGGDSPTFFSQGGRQRGRINIWKAPGGGIDRQTPFTLPVIFFVDP